VECENGRMMRHGLCLRLRGRYIDIGHHSLADRNASHALDPPSRYSFETTRR
jgi:hypothetical protein